MAGVRGAYFAILADDQWLTVTRILRGLRLSCRSLLGSVCMHAGMSKHPSASAQKMVSGTQVHTVAACIGTSRQIM